MQEVWQRWAERVLFAQVTSDSAHSVCSSLPYEVSPAEALRHPEVRRRVEVAAVNLRSLTDRVLNAVTSSLGKLP